MTTREQAKKFHDDKVAALEAALEAEKQQAEVVDQYYDALDRKVEDVQSRVDYFLRHEVQSGEYESEQARNYEGELIYSKVSGYGNIYGSEYDKLTPEEQAAYEPYYRPVYVTRDFTEDELYDWQLPEYLGLKKLLSQLQALTFDVDPADITKAAQAKEKAAKAK